MQISHNFHMIFTVFFFFGCYAKKASCLIKEEPFSLTDSQYEIKTDLQIQKIILLIKNSESRETSKYGYKVKI